jgi:hypothetical protein
VQAFLAGSLFLSIDNLGLIDPDPNAGSDDQVSDVAAASW